MKNYPNAEYLYEFGVSLPLFESMKRSEVKRVCSLLNSYLKEN
jgi:dTDP-4-amino-4,6-dideoxygalactose transaminase